MLKICQLGRITGLKCNSLTLKDGDLESKKIQVSKLMKEPNNQKLEKLGLSIQTDQAEQNVVDNNRHLASCHHHRVLGQGSKDLVLPKKTENCKSFQAQ